MCWNLRRVQYLAATRPKGSPAVVTAKLECMRIPQTVCSRGMPFLPFPGQHGVVRSKPTTSVCVRLYGSSSPALRSTPTCEAAACCMVNHRRSSGDGDACPNSEKLAKGAVIQTAKVGHQSPTKWLFQTTMSRVNLNVCTFVYPNFWPVSVREGFPAVPLRSTDHQIRPLIVGDRVGSHDLSASYPGRRILR